MLKGYRESLTRVMFKNWKRYKNESHRYLVERTF